MSERNNANQYNTRTKRASKLPTKEVLIAPNTVPKPLILLMTGIPKDLSYEDAVKTFEMSLDRRPESVDELLKFFWVSSKDERL